MNSDRYLLVVSGPSGIGKDTVVEKLIGAHPGEIELSVSATTRPPRSYEVDGRHYFFMSETEFLARAQAALVLGQAGRHNKYGGAIGVALFHVGGAVNLNYQHTGNARRKAPVHFAF